MRRVTGRENISSWVLWSKSRRMAPATKTVVIKRPIELMIPSMRKITQGALRTTLPIAPPIWTVSLVVAKNVIMKKKPLMIHARGWRSW